jgi:hypothetical protein
VEDDALEGYRRGEHGHGVQEVLQGLNLNFYKLCHEFRSSSERRFLESILTTFVAG